MTDNDLPLKMNIGDHARQGDTLLRSIAAVPRKVHEMDRDAAGRIVLAHGTATGHAHAFRDEAMRAFSLGDEPDVAFLEINTGGAGATLRHELISGQKAEHDAITWPDGAYEAAAQCEHAPEPIRVSD